MKIQKGMCAKCGHKICMVKYEKNIVDKLSNGEIKHSKGNKVWAVICRVNRCGCLKPQEIKNV